MLKAAGVVADAAARVGREPHLVQLPPEVLQLPGHQVLQHPCLGSVRPDNGPTVTATKTICSSSDLSGVQFTHYTAVV